MLVHLAYGVAGTFAFAAEQPEKRRSETREDQQMSATLELTHKAIGAEVRRGIYDVVFNGERVGSVEMSSTIEIPVEPGRHTLQVRNGRNSSSTQTFDAATLFNPLRRRTQRAVDRRSNRARYDAEATVATFAAGLKDAVNLDSVRDDLASVVQKALEPAHISSWAWPGSRHSASPAADLGRWPPPQSPAGGSPGWGVASGAGPHRHVAGALAELYDDDRFAPPAHGLWLSQHLPWARPVLPDGEGHLGIYEHLGEMLDVPTEPDTPQRRRIARCTDYTAAKVGRWAGPRASSLGGMGSQALPPASLAELVGRWQFAPVVTGFVAVAAGLYLWGVLRVRRRHPARPWPPWRTALFLGGLGVVVIATESGIGSYDDVLFWDHMVQHLLLLMVAPPMLVLGQPATLLLHASRNPLHTWTKRFLRSRVVSWLTWPPFTVALYTAVIVGTHLTGFMNTVISNEAVHNAEHVLYLVAGYLYFLPLLGREPIRWRVSYPTRIFLLFLAMPVDAFTGLVLGSEGSNPFPALAQARPAWAPSPLSDVHIGGAVMWVGGAGLMFAIMMTVFFAWSREARSDGGLGWLEAARRANFARMVSAQQDASARADAPHRPAQVGDSVDDDEHLAAYNEYLARLNKQHER